MSDEAQWFYEESGEQKGPVSESELHRLVDSGEIGSATLVWREGMEQWQAFSESFDRAEGSSPPSLPPKETAVAAAHPPAVAEEPELRTAAIRAGFKPQIRRCLGAAWSQMTQDFWPYLGVYLLFSVIYGVMSQIYIPLLFLTFPCFAGLAYYILRRKRGQAATVDTVFEGFRRQFGPLAILNLIVSGIYIVIMGVCIALILGVVFAIGASNPDMFEVLETGEGDPAGIVALIGTFFVLMIVIGIPLSLLSMASIFAILLLMDCNVTMKEAFALGWEVTKRSWFKMFLFLFVTQLLAFLGMLVLIVGVFVTGTWTTIAFVHLYEDAFGDDEPAAAAA